MSEAIKSAFEQDLDRAQHLEQFRIATTRIRQEILKLETAVIIHDQKADTFDYCDLKTAKYEEVERVRYIRTLINDLQAAF